MLHKLKPRKNPGVDGLPAKLYGRLLVNLKRRLTACLWDIAVGTADIPPDCSNLLHPMYKNAQRGKPTQLQTHCMCHHRGNAHLDGHAEARGPSGIPGHPAHDMKSKTRTLAA